MPFQSTISTSGSVFQSAYPTELDLSARAAGMNSPAYVLGVCRELLSRLADGTDLAEIWHNDPMRRAAYEAELIEGERI